MTSSTMTAVITAQTFGYHESKRPPLENVSELQLKFPQTTWSLPTTPAEYQKTLADLGKILNKFKRFANDDYLSKRINRFITRLIARPIETFLNPETNVLKELSKFERILSNPLNHDVPLKAPVLVGDNRVWCEETLREYKEKTGRTTCPYDGTEMAVPIPHLLGRECIKFLDQFRKKPALSIRYSLLPIGTKETAEAYFNYYVTVLVQPYLLSQQLYETMQRTKIAITEIKASAVIIDEDLKVEEERHKAALETIEKNCLDRFEAQQKAHDKDLAAAKAKQQELEEMQAALEAQQKITSQQLLQQSQEISRLFVEIARRQREIAALQAQVNNSSGNDFCVIC